MVAQNGRIRAANTDLASTTNSSMRDEAETLHHEHVHYHPSTSNVEGRFRLNSVAMPVEVFRRTQSALGPGVGG
jgi:hypothetical protein